MNAKGERKPGRSPVYSTLVSIKTSLVFLGALAFFFFLGTIFPQSSDPNRLEQYREAGGKFVRLVGALELLDIFRSWYFTLLAALFALHLALCIIHRIGILRRRPSFRLFTREDLSQRDYSFSVSRPPEAAAPDIEKTLKRLGFRRPRYYSEDARVKRVVCEKGFPFRWLSWLYHVCLVLSIVGFCLTSLFAFRGHITVAVGERKAVALGSHETNWRKLMSLLGRDRRAKERKIEIELEQFITEHTQKAALRYPDDPAGRLLAAWGLGKESVHYEMPEDPLYPRDWFSVLDVYDGGKLVRHKKIGTNDPLRCGGLTFYQIGYEYKFDLNAGGENIEDVTVREAFTIPQMEGEFRISSPHTGILFRLDESVEKLTPSAKLQHRPPSGPENQEWTTVGEMTIGQPVEILHAEMTLTSMRESSVLSYRYDPGIPLLWVAGMALVVLMATRIYLPWYQVRCHAEDSTSKTMVTASIRVVGLFARPARLKQKLSNAFLE